MSQLYADCLYQIFEFLEEDKATLYSCLLVNRLWCEVSVRILWKNIWDNQLPLKIINTLIACLPSGSKEHLQITLETEPPLFNYPSFCRALSINEIVSLVFHGNLTHIFDFKNKHENIIVQEILKMFMNQNPFLRKLSYCSNDYYDLRTPNNTGITGSIDCLTRLSELICYSNIHSDFFYQLSQICHNIKSLNVTFVNSVSNGLKDLILSQNGLEELSLSLSPFSDNVDSTEILLSLTKHSNTITKLDLNGPLFSISFITRFTNLEELVLHNPDDNIQHAKFPQLQILKLYYPLSNEETFVKFLKNNGRNLKEFHIIDTADSVNSFDLTVARFCPNLKILYTRFTNRNEIQILKVIFKSCQQLESIGIFDISNSNLKNILEVIAKCSPKNFHELILYEVSDLFPGDLSSFFESWKDRIPQKPLSFIMEYSTTEYPTTEYLNREIVINIMKVAETYKNLGIIKNYTIHNSLNILPTAVTTK